MFLRFVIWFCFALASAHAAPQVKIMRRGYFNSGYTLVEGRDGAIYGAGEFGRVFRMTKSGGYRAIHQFDGDVVEINSLVAAPDGNLYGAGEPGLFRMTYDGVADDLPYSETAPGMPHSLVVGNDGNIYGLTDSYPAASKLFRVTLDGIVTVVADLASSPTRVARSMTVGHDGAMWIVGKDQSSKDRIARVSLDGTITDPIVSGELAGWTTRLLRHPDGNFYCFCEGITEPTKFMRLSPQGELTVVRQLDTHLQWLSQYSQTIGTDEKNYFCVWHPTAGDASQLVWLDTNGNSGVVAGPLRGPLSWLAECPILSAHDGTLYMMSTLSVSGKGAFARISDRPQSLNNLPPLARQDTARPPKPGESVSIKLLANDYDADRDPLTVTSVGNPELGTATLDPAGKTVLYTAPLGEPVQVDQFEYRITDSKGGTAIGRVVLRADVRGSFNNLLESDELDWDGNIGVVLGKFGALSCRLWLGGYTTSFTGHLDEENRLSITRRVGEKSTLITLELSEESFGPVIRAKVEHESGSVESVLTRPSLSAANAHAGEFTFLIPRQSNWEEEPEFLPGFNDPPNPNPLYGFGCGFGRMRIAKSGVVSMAGRLPDGTPISGGQSLDRAGQIFFSNLSTL